MMHHIDETELKTRIELNLKRFLNDPYYTIEGVFAPAEYDWQGDKEGRALLAFVSHYKINKTVVPCMDLMLAEMPNRTNRLGFFGDEPTDIIFEQQLSGHSWLLRGLCEHYEAFGDDFSLQTVKRTVDGLYMPTLGKYSSYPVNRETKDEGGVSGNSTGIIDGWRLSSDVGCAFMSIDGLSHAYKITRDERIKSLVDEMIDVYMGIDKVAIKAQTHCTLTAARGMMRMYSVTGDKKYLDRAKKICELYTRGGGMTYTYQNLNWWGRPDTWTEPCAIVDSLMLCGELYRATGEENYRRTAARIYANGLATSQRANGGAGTDTVVYATSPWKYLKADMYEAFFCCTMRLAEGLWYINANKDIFDIESGSTPAKDEHGCYLDGDILYAEVNEIGKKYARKSVSVDGHELSPLIKYYLVPDDDMTRIEQTVVFD